VISISTSKSQNLSLGFVGILTLHKNPENGSPRSLAKANICLDAVATLLIVLHKHIRVTIFACVGVENGFGKATSLLKDRQTSVAEKVKGLRIAKEAFRRPKLTIPGYLYDHSSLPPGFDADEVFDGVHPHAITPRGDQRKIAYALLGLILTACIASICIEATRCGAVRPWQTAGRECANYVSYLRGIATNDF
jgi:hypothetical protein